MTEEEVKDLASEYQVQIEDYREAEFIRLLGSGVCRENYDDDGRLIEEYREKDYYKNFISATQFSEVTGLTVTVEPGTYQYISREGNTESYWFMPEDLDKAENTATGKTLEVAYAGTVKYSSFFWNRGQDGSAAYVTVSHEKISQLLADMGYNKQVNQKMEQVGMPSPDQLEKLSYMIKLLLIRASDSLYDGVL